MSKQFTIEGYDGLESHLQALCGRVSDRIAALPVMSVLRGLVIGGGYGRGQGSVLEVPQGDRAYNDLCNRRCTCACDFAVPQRWPAYG